MLLDGGLKPALGGGMAGRAQSTEFFHEHLQSKANADDAGLNICFSGGVADPFRTAALVNSSSKATVVVRLEALLLTALLLAVRFEALRLAALPLAALSSPCLSDATSKVISTHGARWVACSSEDPMRPPPGLPFDPDGIFRSVRLDGSARRAAVRKLPQQRKAILALISPLAWTSTLAASCLPVLMLQRRQHARLASHFA